MKIYHIVLPDMWAAFGGTHYEAESLASEGFIHCSFEDQLESVLKRYYADRDEVVILEIDPEKLDSTLVVEPSTGGQNYPHIYGAINRDAIIGSTHRKLN
jgi:uncharacterized protein (DUF952 family)